MKSIQNLVYFSNATSDFESQPVQVKLSSFFIFEIAPCPFAFLWRKERKCDNAVICTEHVLAERALLSQRKVFIVSLLYLKMTSPIGFYLLRGCKGCGLGDLWEGFLVCGESLFIRPSICSTTFLQAACQDMLAHVC